MFFFTRRTLLPSTSFGLIIIRTPKFVLNLDSRIALNTKPFKIFLICRWADMANTININDDVYTMIHAASKMHDGSTIHTICHMLAKISVSQTKPDGCNTK